MFPLDKETLIESAKKTSRAIVIDEGYERYGVTAELAAVIAEGAFYYLDAPVKRMGAMDVPVPFSPVLEDLTVPTAAIGHRGSEDVVWSGLDHCKVYISARRSNVWRLKNIWLDGRGLGGACQL